MDTLHIEFSEPFLNLEKGSKLILDKGWAIIAIDSGLAFDLADPNGDGPEPYRPLKTLKNAVREAVANEIVELADDPAEAKKTLGDYGTNQPITYALEASLDLANQWQVHLAKTAEDRIFEGRKLYYEITRRS